MDNKILLQGLSIIEACVNKRFGDEQVRVYAMLLNDLNEELYIEGVKRLMSERVYTNLPSVAEIREFSLGNREGDIELKIHNAKNDIQKAIDTVGSYREVCFSDPVIHYIIQLQGGWIKFCKMSREELADFIKWELPKIYKSTVNKKLEVPLFLTGLGYNDRDKPELRYIGDKTKVDRWQLSYVKKNKNTLDEIEYKKASQLNLLTGIEYKKVNELLEGVNEDV